MFPNFRQSLSSIGTGNMSSESYVEAKTVLDSAKSSAWRFFKFRVSGDDVDKSYVHCMLCLDAGHQKKGQIKYCGGTTNLTNHLKAWHKADYKCVEKEEAPKQSILNHFGAQTKTVPKWPKSSERWKELTLAITKWFCKSSRSTMMVEDPGFFIIHLSKWQNSVWLLQLLTV